MFDIVARLVILALSALTLWLVLVLARHLGLPAVVAVAIGIPTAITVGIFGFLGMMYALDRFFPAPSSSATPQADEETSPDALS